MINEWKKETNFVHSSNISPENGDVMTPIHLSSTYRKKNIDIEDKYEYSRSGNPTRDSWEQCLATSENGKYGFVFSSGLAACDTILNLLDSGDHCLSISDVLWWN